MDIVVTGAGHVLLAPDPDRPTPGTERDASPDAWLRVRKSRKYMARHDDLAVLSAGRAIERAGLRGAPLGERAGLYLCAGFLAFDARDFAPVLEASTTDGRFDLGRFTREGVHKAPPLLTFRCLPNMPAFHVSVNFDIRGPYLVTYPGGAQTHQCLDAAVQALEDGSVDVALVTAVAHQRNFLTAHHLGRLDPPTPSDALRDAGATLVLESDAHARARGATPLAVLRERSNGYVPFDPDAACGESTETLLAPDGASLQPSGDTGAAHALVRVSWSLTQPGAWRCAQQHRDGCHTALGWEVLP